MNDKSKTYSVKFYAEMKLDDGRIVATEDEQFMIGSKVFVVSDDGGAEALPKGEYTMENGNKMSIGEGSEILDLGEEKEAEDVEASEENKEEMEESIAEETDWAKTFEEMKDRVAALEEKVFGKKGEEETEELSKEEENTEEEKTDKTKMSSEDVIGELITQVEDLSNKVVELSKSPATEELKYNPQGNNMSSTVDLKGLSVKERATYYINNK